MRDSTPLHRLVTCFLLLSRSGGVASSSEAWDAWGQTGAAAEPNLIAIYGRLYDITQIATWHPGGAAILKQVRSLRLSDATPLFESQHALRDPDEMRHKLVPYQVNGTASPPRLYTFHETGFYRVLRRRVAAHLTSLGLTGGASDAPGPVKLAAPKGNTYIVLKWSVFMLVAVALLCASVRATRTSTVALFAFAGGFVFTTNLFVLLHDASHFASFTRSIETTTFASRLTQSVAYWDLPTWRAHHVLQHHAFTGDPTRDPDLRNGNPYFCKTPEAYSCNPSTPRLQFLTALTFMYSGQAFIYLNGRFDVPTRGPWDGAASRHAVGLDEAIRGVNDERWRWWQYAVALWPLALVYALFRSARAQGLDWRGASARVLVAVMMLMLGMNVCYAMNILVDHDSLATVQSLHGHLESYGTSPSDWGEIQVRGRPSHPYPHPKPHPATMRCSPSPSLHLKPQLSATPTLSAARLSSTAWAATQIRAAGNWAGPVWCFFFGGINYQIEHHLFPTIFHDYYPLIAPVVRATAKEFNISYTAFDSVYGGLSSALAQFTAAAAEAAAANATAINQIILTGNTLSAADREWANDKSTPLSHKRCSIAVASLCAPPVPHLALMAVQTFVVLSWTLLFVSIGACAKACLSSVRFRTSKSRFVKVRCESERVALSKSEGELIETASSSSSTEEDARATW